MKSTGEHRQESIADLKIGHYHKKEIGSGEK